MAYTRRACIAYRVPTSYSQARAMAKNGPKRLSANTTVEQSSRGYAVRLHRTRIIHFYQDGRIKLYSGGYRTKTTKKRLNECLANTPYRVVQCKREWHVTRTVRRNSTSFRADIPFTEGVEITEFR